ncbi:4-hydroxythreonine-4-phosphate dehydrogenase PdxA [Coraliomargarita sp. SDUM461004]|uniref:4-hydroxythreonine-4-phosphate dehydrogenase PdxA n=1 Tax=Thalassobacterium sedimentorum TaxID=3041258 RepID=A0ABU1AIB4_9BACT|nr:4-hydroxythreonine-4-phosphate dehydrogenase PdxA [Coraliomargarita sp. SDUM461004]MDQ8194535.1 4-hydroxythreonine-4-phosphate dehydrogenase PdxA [Coraliomargarita sp. SDUM461004]
MIKSYSSLPLALTCGDPAGIGPEVIESALAVDGLHGRDCVLIGPAHWGAALSEKLGVSFEAVTAHRARDFVAQPGVPSINGASLALAAMERAAAGCREGRFRGVVTGPVSKHWLQLAGFQFPGQTEFFANAWGGDPTMAFVGRELRVVLATWHIPLRDVSQALDAACLEQAVRRAYALAHQFGAREPRIGVCGLNPHAGEGGILGLEELEVLDPTLDRLRAAMPGLSRCLPGDTVFHRQRQGDFDVVVAAYHDQALAAVKTLEFDAAVNLTLGLPYVRTSPDHGTAFDLAGAGTADPSSFSAALAVARNLTGSAAKAS